PQAKNQWVFVPVDPDIKLGDQGLVSQQAGNGEGLIYGLEQSPLASQLVPAEY
ncbi:unnamed protein product, partial [marine sediment metagenome]